VLCLVCAFRYLKLHDDIDVDALEIEPKLLKNIALSFVLDTFETICDVSKALTSALKGIYRTVAAVLDSSNVKMLQQKNRAVVLVPSMAEELHEKQIYPRALEPQDVFAHSQTRNRSGRSHYNTAKIHNSK